MTLPANFTPWACPHCGMDDNGKHSERVPLDACKYQGGIECGCFCECDDDGDPGEHHGSIPSNPCPFVQCYHCGFNGTLPAPSLPRPMQFDWDDIKFLRLALFRFKHALNEPWGEHRETMQKDLVVVEKLYEQLGDEIKWGVENAIEGIRDHG